MAASFNPNLSNGISKVRQFVGDTDINAAEIDDATISAYLNTPMTPLRTAAQLAYDLAAKYTRKADFTVDDQRNYYSKVSRQYMDLGAQLTRNAVIDESRGAAGVPDYGAIIVTGVGDCRGPIDDYDCRPRRC